MSGPRFVPPAEDFEPPPDTELHQPPPEPADPCLPPIGLDEYGPDMGQVWEDRPPGGSS